MRLASRYSRGVDIVQATWHAPHLSPYRLAIDNLASETDPPFPKTDANSRKRDCYCYSFPRIATLQSNVQRQRAAATRYTHGLARRVVPDLRPSRQQKLHATTGVIVEIADRQSQKAQPQHSRRIRRASMQDYCKCRMHHPMRLCIRLAGVVAMFQAGL